MYFSSSFTVGRNLPSRAACGQNSRKPRQKLCTSSTVYGGSAPARLAVTFPMLDPAVVGSSPVTSAMVSKSGFGVRWGLLLAFLTGNERPALVSPANAEQGSSEDEVEAEDEDPGFA